MTYRIYYISEASAPSTSAYSIHVAKMCEAFAGLNYDVGLIVPNAFKSFKVYSKYYNIRHKYNLISIFDYKLNLNFFSRLLFSFKVLNFLKKENVPFKIISRSIVTSLLLSLNKINNTLELHHEINGISFFFFKILKFFKFFNKINFIFIHKNLINKINLPKQTKYIVLDDAADIENFKLTNSNNKKKNTIVYIGSFFRGKGLEIINEIAKKNNNFKFHLFGDVKTIHDLTIKKNKNISFKGHVPYSKIPKVLSNYEIAIMPYREKVFVRSKRLEVSKTMSPLKMFDYLSNKMVIIASDLKVYNHILINGFNSILIKPNNFIGWEKALTKTSNQKFKNKLKKNAYQTALKYSWKNRATKIVNYSFNIN